MNNDLDQSDPGQSGPAATTTTGLRFLTLEQVAEELATSQAQAYALVRNGELRAFKLGGRGQWRIGRTDLEDYITRTYQETAEFIATHPFVETSRAQATDTSHGGGDVEGTE